MKTTYIGQEKFITLDSRIFRITEESEAAAAEAEWAYGVLAQPEVTYQNGRNSHVIAGEILDKAEDILLNYLCITA